MTEELFDDLPDVDLEALAFQDDLDEMEAKLDNHQEVPLLVNTFGGKTFYPKVAEIKRWLKKGELQRIVELYRGCGGDLRATLHHLVGPLRSKQQKAMFDIEYLLQEPENAQWKAKWEQVTAAFQRSRLQLVQREAFDVLSGSNNKLKENIPYVKFILSDLLQYRATAAKKEAEAKSKDRITETDRQLIELFQKIDAKESHDRENVPENSDGSNQEGEGSLSA